MTFLSPRSVILAVTMLSVLSTCGSDDDGAVVFQVGRYCDLFSQFQGAALATGASSAPGRYDGSPEAIGQLLTQTGPTVDELRATAPGEVRDDVDLVLKELRNAQEGGTSAAGSEPLAEANDRIQRYGEANCQSAGGSGDQ